MPRPDDGRCFLTRGKGQGLCALGSASFYCRIIALAFLSTDDTFCRLFQFADDESGANPADMLISDPSLGVDKKTFWNARRAIVNRNLGCLVLAVRIRNIELFQKLESVLIFGLYGQMDKDHFCVFDVLCGRFQGGG